MTPLRPSSPKIVGVSPRMPSLYADERRGIFRKAVVELIASSFREGASDKGQKMEIENIPELSSTISSMIEGHLIDLDWMDSVNPADSAEIGALRKASASLLSRLNRLSDPGRRIINYDWKETRPNHETVSLVSKIASDLKTLNTKIDSIVQARTQQGRPKKDIVARLCIQSVRIWEIFSEERFPTSLRVHNNVAIDRSFLFAFQLVRIFKTDAKISEVRYQLQKVARTKKMVRAAD